MARLPRLFLPEFPVHAVVRGNDRQDIFQSEGDRVFFHRCLVETTRKHETSVHAYVFMTNHVHLLVTGKTPNSLGKVIQTMGRRYVSYFNYLMGSTPDSRHAAYGRLSEGEMGGDDKTIRDALKPWTNDWPTLSSAPAGPSAKIEN